MKSIIRALNEFSRVSILFNARDSQYQALGWQIIAAKIGMQRCAASSQWLNERISLSRYAHVFALLLAEFRKLGAAIIFANFAKIIIDTGKSDLSAAKAYSE